MTATSAEQPVHPARRLPAVLVGAALWAAILGLLVPPTGCSNEATADAYARSVIKVVGQRGLADGQFFYPRAIAVASDGRFFVADKTGRIQRFSPDGAIERVWRTPESEAGMPVGMTVGPDGRLYVADTHYHRILIYDQEGNLLDQFGREGMGPGEFLLPTDVAVDRQGHIYVSEAGGNDRISKLAPDRSLLWTFGGRDAGEDNPLARPVGLVIDRESRLWAADATHNRLLCFSPDGRIVAEISSAGTAPGQLRYPYDLAVLPDGTLLVAEYGNNRLQQLTMDGRSVRIWGTAGWQPGQLGYPWGVAVADGRVLAVDSGNNRVQMIEW